MTDVSFVIPAIHEFPALYHTLFAIQVEMEDLGMSYEMIVVENGEKDVHTPKFLTLFRVPIARKLIKYLFEPIQCGPIARMTGAKEAQGRYLVFLDAHSALGKNTIPLLINTLEGKNAGEVHGVTVKTHWDSRQAGGHYQLFGGGGPKLNSHFHGTYCRATGNEPYQVGGATLAYVIFNREEFLKLRGYHPACRFYPHPEGYLPLKYWMFDREVWLHPKAYHFHSNYPRNYGSKIKEGLTIQIRGDPYRLIGNDNLIRNAMICSYTLGGEPWIQRVYEYWSKRVRSKYVLNGIREDARASAEEEYQWILDNAHHTLDEVLQDLHQRKTRGVELLE